MPHSQRRCVPGDPAGPHSGSQNKPQEVSYCRAGVSSGILLTKQGLETSVVSKHACLRFDRTHPKVLVCKLCGEDSTGSRVFELSQNPKPPIPSEHEAG